MLQSSEHVFQGVRQLLDSVHTYCPRSTFQAVGSPEKITQDFLFF